MCGIAGGCWTSTGGAIDDETVTRMAGAMTHRGPDDAGSWSHRPEHPTPETPGAALGFRRLSIIDLAGGHQPMANEDETVWLIFNGEIYNYRELRPELERAGHAFRTDTDSEVIIHAYEEYGDACVDRFRGMFAFAIWDGRKNRLLLARDRIGQKPLFYRHEPGRLVFASELKSLLQISDLPRTLNLQAIDLFLAYQYVPHPYSILEGFSKLPPGYLGIYERGHWSVRSYWEPPYALSQAAPTLPDEDCGSWSVARWQSMLRERLTESVRLRMRSDVPIGAFLSGGVDSTIIAGLMQSLSEHPIHSFSIGFPVREFDEREYARCAAEHLKTDHHEYVVEPSAVDVLPQLVWQYDEPFGDSSAIPMLYLSEVTRRLVTVALSGDGGDELFAGYNRYQAVRLAGRLDRLPAVFRRMCGWPIWQKIPTSQRQGALGRRAKRFAAALAQSPEDRYGRWINIFDDDRRRSLYSQRMRDDLNGFDARQYIRDLYAKCPDRDFITRTTCVDVLSYLPNDILTKVDIASMTHSLECRNPFLDHHVVELAAKMPIELKLEERRAKAILIDTFADLLPAKIQNRSKMGFGVPLVAWFRKELKALLQGVLLSEQTFDRGLWNPDTVRGLVRKHVEGVFDHSYRLWNLLVLEMWLRTYLDRQPTGPLEL